MAEKEKIQEVPEGWETLYIRNKAILEYGEGLPEEKREEGDVPVYGSNGIVGYHDNYLIKGPGIIIGRKGTVGAVNFTTENYWPIDTAYYIRFIGEGDNIKWFYYYLTTLNLTSLNSATGVPGLNRDDVYDLKIKCPPLPEQRTIASILSTCDEAIDKTDAKIEKLKSIKQGLMQDLFRYGIDENGKMRSEATHHFKNSPLCRIPEEWEVKTLEDVSEKIADRDHTTPKYIENGVPIVSPQDFDKNEKINFNNCAMISLKDHLINRKKTDIEFDDIVFTRIGAGLGKSCLVTKEMPEFSILHSAAMIRANKNRILPLYLLYSLKSFNLQKQIVDGIQSIGVPDLGMDKMKQLRLVMPINLTEQSRIASVLSAADEAIEKEEAYKNKLLALKRGLMDDLLSGKVRVNKLIREAA